MSMNDQTEEIIRQYEKYTGKNLRNYPVSGPPGTTLQNNAEETINMT